MKKIGLVIVALLVVGLAIGGFVVKNDKGDTIFKSAVDKIFRGNKQVLKKADPRVIRKYEALKEEFNEMKNEYERAKRMDEAERKKVKRKLFSRCFGLTADVGAFYNEYKDYKTDDFNPEDVKKLEEEIVEFSKVVRK